MNLEKEFEQCFNKFFPIQGSMMRSSLDVMIKMGITDQAPSFSRKFDHPTYVDNNVVQNVPSYNLEDSMFGGIIMKVAFGMFDGDLEYLLSKFNGGAEFNKTMRAIYAEHHK